MARFEESSNVDLILWRHADAGDAVPGEDDLARELTRKGERHARRIARWLEHHLPEGARVWVSPAMRAEQTAQALGRQYKLQEGLAPQASLADVLGLLKWDAKRGIRGSAPLLLVGHQPVLGQLAAHLLGMPDHASAIRKGAAWWLRMRVTDGTVQVVLAAANTPDLASSSWDAKGGGGQRQ